MSVWAWSRARRDEGALSPCERFAVGLGRLTNETRHGKRAQETFLRSIAYTWMRASLARRFFVEGLDELTALQPQRGVMFVSNHRSFFDQYAMMLAVWMGPTPWARHLYFPVRAQFFYDSLLGILVNYLAGAGVMYPPIFRHRARAPFNREALRLMVGFLEQRNSVLGLHPEGTRNKGHDPYTLLPSQPGTGEIALRAAPIIIPVFINGLSNDLLGEIRSNYRQGIRRRRPCICVFGAAIDYQDLLDQEPRPALYKQVGDRCREAILALGARERRLRERCAAGEISDDAQGWLPNRGMGRFYAHPS